MKAVESERRMKGGLPVGLLRGWRWGGDGGEESTASGVGGVVARGGVAGVAEELSRTCWQARQGSSGGRLFHAGRRSREELAITPFTSFEALLEETRSSGRAVVAGEKRNLDEDQAEEI